MRFLVALLSTLLVAPAAHAGGASGDRPDPYGDKLIEGGAIAFTVAYVPTTVAGTVLAGLTHGAPDFAGPGFAPVAGPFVWASNFILYGHGSNESVLLGTLAILDGVVQVGGLACLIAGGVHRHRVAAQATTTLSRR